MRKSLLCQQLFHFLLHLLQYLRGYFDEMLAFGFLKTERRTGHVLNKTIVHDVI